MTLLAQDQFLLKDLNPGPDPSAPHEMLELNGFMFFIAYDGTTNRLWQSNSIRTGTNVLSSNHFDVKELTIINNFLYFTAADVTGNRGLYITDGIIGNPINSISTNSLGDSNPSNIMQAADGRVYFFADTSSNGRQLHSMFGNNSASVQMHLPSDPTYQTGFLYRNDIGTGNFQEYFGNKGIVNAGQFVYYYVINPSSLATDLWGMDYSVTTPAPVLVAPNIFHVTNVPPHAFDNKVFITGSQDLSYYDGTSFTTLLPGVIPNSLTNAGGRMYFSGLRTSGGFSWVLYDVDNLLNVTEHQSIPAEQPFGSQFLYRGVLTLSNGKLYAWRFLGTNGMYEIDITNPALPTASRVFRILPYDMSNIFPYGNLFFFAASNAPSFSVYRAYATGEEPITEPNAGPDNYPSDFFFYFGSLFYADTVTPTQIVDCNPPSSYGREIYKLTDSQLGCSTGLFYSNAFFQDGIYATKQTLDVLPTSTAVSGTCTILLSQNINLTGLTIAGQFQTITGSCK